MKYSKTELINYIYGNDTENDIEVLEDDPEFMLEVLTSTNDKNFYKLCSAEVKKNYGFVSKVILTFRNDLGFICRVANTYLENNIGASDIDELELLIIMQELLEQGNNEESLRYGFLVESKFQGYRLAIELAKLEDDENVQNIGMGFLIIYNQYSSSNIITRNFAKRMIMAILEENDIDLEQYMHECYKSFEEIKKIGIRASLLKLISSYDECLSSYIGTHIDLLDDLESKMVKIEKNWALYNHLKEKNKYECILNYVRQYMDNIEFETSYDELEILYYIARELGIAECILKYDMPALYEMFANEIITEEEYLSTIESCVNTIDKGSWTFADYKHYTELKRTIENILRNNSCEEEVLPNKDNNIINFDDLKI